MNESQPADWMSLVLHYVAGALITLGGAHLGFYRFMSGLTHQMDQPGAWMIALGMVLFGGGFAGLFQDWLWNPKAYWLISDDRPQHSIWSRMLMILSLAVGLAMFARGIHLYA